MDADNVALRELAVTDADAQGGGAVFAADDSELELADVRLFDNTATTGGGALAVGVDATVTVLRTTMDENSAVGGFGGAVWNAGNLFVHESLLADNQSLRAGAIRNTGGAVLNLRNTTLSGNSVDSSTSAGGGGLVNTAASFAFLNNATIYDNHGRGPTPGNIAGGGIYTGNDSTTVVKNSIIAGNDDPFGPGDCVGPVSSDSRYNLLEDTGGCGLPAVTSTWVLGRGPGPGAASEQRRADPLAPALVHEPGGGRGLPVPARRARGGLLRGHRPARRGAAAVRHRGDRAPGDRSHRHHR